MLSLFQFVLDLVQSINQLFKFLRHFAEEWRYFGVFKVLELGNDVIALFPGLDPIHEVFRPMAATRSRCANE